MLLSRSFHFLLGILWGGVSSMMAADRPNIIIILTDDLGYGDLSCYRPGADIHTPYIDELAHEGMRFTHMRANCTVCAPSRAALLSGKFADRVGVPGLIRAQPEASFGYFDTKTATLANCLHDLGYHTTIVGKWNLGLTSPNTPNERGFDLFHGFLEDMMDSYTTHLRHGVNFMRLNQEVVNPRGHATDVFTDWACDDVRKNAEAKRPFFLYLAYNAPHYPIEPPDEWLQRVKRRVPGIDEKRALNVALIEHLDDRIGRLLTTLKAAGVDQNTLLIFSSDNGGLLSVAANNDPWRGGKSDFYDGGVCVPFIVRWPGKVAAGSQSDYAGLLFDAFPTAIAAAGGSAPAGIDATSLLPVLQNPGLVADQERDLYFVRREGGPIYGGKSYEAIVRGDWKLMQNNPYAPLELYNLKTDPQEKNNVIAENPRVAAELKGAMRLHIQKGGATPWEPPSSDIAATKTKKPPAAADGARPEEANH